MFGAQPLRNQQKGEVLPFGLSIPPLWPWPSLTEGGEGRGWLSYRSQVWEKKKARDLNSEINLLCWPKTRGQRVPD